MNAPASGDRINYTLRPAKSVERKMLRDLFCILYPFGPVDEYKYIGFGSKYFSDFKLFHRALHIREMVSIEGDIGNPDKYEFNKPFNCVDLKIGTSNEVLSSMKHDKKFIAWLDYDSAIAEPMLVDLEILIENLYSGSLILSSFNCTPYGVMALKEEFQCPHETHPVLLRKKFETLVPLEFVPLEVPQQGLSKAAVHSSVLKGIFENKIKKALLEKNAALADQDKWEFSQLIYFNYKDGAEMGTLGWLFYQKKDVSKFEDCKFTSLDFFNNGDDGYKIDIPNLTIKEIRLLQESMPLPVGPLDRVKMPECIFSNEDVFSFSKVYKYFPNFTDIEIA